MATRRLSTWRRRAGSSWGSARQGSLFISTEARPGRAERPIVLLQRPFALIKKKRAQCMLGMMLKLYPVTKVGPDKYQDGRHLARPVDIPCVYFF